MEFRDIINRWPSLADAAEDAGLEYNAVRMWRSRNRIPAEYWRRLVRGGHRRGVKVSLEDFATAAENGQGRAA